MYVSCYLQSIIKVHRLLYDDANILPLLPPNTQAQVSGQVATRLSERYQERKVSQVLQLKITFGSGIINAFIGLIGLLDSIEYC